jgi:uncharacterized membrane protein
MTVSPAEEPAAPQAGQTAQEEAAFVQPETTEQGQEWTQPQGEQTPPQAGQTVQEEAAFVQPETTEQGQEWTQPQGGQMPPQAGQNMQGGAYAQPGAAGQGQGWNQPQGGQMPPQAGQNMQGGAYVQPGAAGQGQGWNQPQGGQMPPQAGQNMQGGAYAQPGAAGQGQGWNQPQGGQNPSVCSRCGAQVAPNVPYCPVCGTLRQGAATPPPYGQGQPGSAPNMGQGPAAAFGAFQQTNDFSGEYRPEDIAQNKVMAVLSYFSILVLIPIFGAKNSPYARFHANQGLLLWIAGMAAGLVYNVLALLLQLILGQGIFILQFLWFAICIAMMVFSIMGIINAVKGRAKELPLIGKLRLLK